MSVPPSKLLRPEPKPGKATLPKETVGALITACNRIDSLLFDCLELDPSSEAHAATCDLISKVVTERVMVRTGQARPMAELAQDESHTHFEKLQKSLIELQESIGPVDLTQFFGQMNRTIRDELASAKLSHLQGFSGRGAS